MSWAQKRIEEYKQGKDATWLEKQVLEHANPVHLVLAIIGFALIVYGLWTHNWWWIGFGFASNLLGHLYCYLKK